MGFDDKYTSVYSNPEKFGLKVLIEKEDPEAFYSFEMVIVWEDANGKLYWASDSGCSCPSPFENYTTLESLNTGTVSDLIDFLKAWLEDWYNSWKKDAAHEVLKRVVLRPISSPIGVSIDVSC